MITGPNGFLYNQLTMEDSDDLLFLLGSPTTDNKVMLDEYVQTTKDIIRSNRHKYTVFASTAWTEQSDDYYNKSKKELELFIEENCSKYLILKIADIISTDLEKVKQMKADRMQQQILQNDLSEIPMKGHYLDLNIFIAETQHAIRNKDTGVHNYSLVELTLLELKSYAN
tara:strand:- start:64 stop:573 length:510 start_codon:yes stop_codon:yes gene_type:complete